MEELIDHLKTQGLALGFVRARVAPAEGGGVWLMFALPYLPASDQARATMGWFACHDNYDHAVGLVKQLRRMASDKLALPVKNMRIICNSSDINEKVLGASCGLGVYGKNSLLLIPEWGSFVVLCALYLPIEVSVDPVLDVNEHNCEDCTICIGSCPTKALHKPYVCDTQLCAQAWVSKGLSPQNDDWPPMIYGCDRCQMGCPKNKKALDLNKKAVAMESKWTQAQLWERGQLDIIAEAIAQSPLRFKWLNKENLINNARLRRIKLTKKDNQ
jgi:epoxyqueuosine reductase QueG